MHLLTATPSPLAVSFTTSHDYTGFTSKTFTLELYSRLAAGWDTDGIFPNGILTESSLNSQLLELASGKDANEEHCRYTCFVVYLNRQAIFSDAQVAQIVKLFQSDPDKTMAGSALAKLLEKQSLTDKQFTIVSEALPGFGKWTEKKIKNQREKRENA